jgi:hypothetical protein
MKLTERSGDPAEPPRAVDRQLRGRRPGQQVHRGDRVFELAIVEPAAARDAEFPQQRDVRRRAAESDAPDASPLAQNDA